MNGNIKRKTSLSSEGIPLVERSTKKVGAHHFYSRFSLTRTPKLLRDSLNLSLNYNAPTAKKLQLFCG